MRAPGRVNLIGEHIDYALFGVFPAAIERDILLACAPCDSHGHQQGAVRVQNLDHRFPPQSFSPLSTPSVGSEVVENEAGVRDAGGWHLDIDKKELHWESYVKAGYYGVLSKFFSPAVSCASVDKCPVPVDLLVSGTVPPGSGLSSSAALVVASTLAFLAVNNKLDDVTKRTLVEMAVENEKRVGVNSEWTKLPP